jgi:cytoskeletal protein RodZ
VFADKPLDRAKRRRAILDMYYRDFMVDLYTSPVFIIIIILVVAFIIIRYCYKKHNHKNSSKYQNNAANLKIDERDEDSETRNENNRDIHEKGHGK